MGQAGIILVLMVGGGGKGTSYITGMAFKQIFMGKSTNLQ
jgi:hypothetical protein